MTVAKNDGTKAGEGRLTEAREPLLAVAAKADAYGPIRRSKLSRTGKVSVAALARNWATIPHVTNFEEADITEWEAFRLQCNEKGVSRVKVTTLALLVKAIAAALKVFPHLNASLDGDELVLKQYYNIGVAVDTADGLLVPIVRNADMKGVCRIAEDIAALSSQARSGKLQLADVQGGTFSVSNLGGIGGTGFTPIVNAPEVAILGVVRACTKPVWDGKQFCPRLMLPLSLSWDHRAIDGAMAARFLSYLAELLSNPLGCAL